MEVNEADLQMLIYTLSVDKSQDVNNMTVNMSLIETNKSLNLLCKLKSILQYHCHNTML